MSAMIQKWGSSHAIRLPKAILEQAGILPGEEVRIEAEGDVITIRPARKRKRIPIKELVRGMTPEKNRYPEFEDGPKGREVF